MQVEDRIRKNVVFIGVFEENRFLPKATGFYASIAHEGFNFINVVTAEHVISGLMTRGYDHIYIRANSANGGVEMFKSNARDWFFHPEAERINTDVAVIPVSLANTQVEWVSADESVFIKPGDIASHEFGVGDEVFAVGLFRAHPGKGRNIPIIRVGNLAALPEEPVHTKYCGDMEAYLIEARSIAGLSGSPVWIHHLPVRVRNNVLEHGKGLRPFLLGMVHGHFDVQNLSEEMVTDDNGGGGINTGIGVVVPAYRIMETLMHPTLVEGRRKAAERVRGEAATADLALDNEKPENERHKEDFTSLLNAAARKKPQGD